MAACRFVSSLVRTWLIGLIVSSGRLPGSSRGATISSNLIPVLAAFPTDPYESVGKYGSKYGSGPVLVEGLQSRPTASPSRLPTGYSPTYYLTYYLTHYLTHYLI